MSWPFKASILKCTLLWALGVLLLLNCPKYHQALNSQKGSLNFNGEAEKAQEFQSLGSRRVSCSGH